MKKPLSKTNSATTAAEPGLAYHASASAFPLPQDAYAAIGLIRNGLTMSALTGLMRQMETSLAQMAMLLHTSERTLRRYEASMVLSAEQSERVIELQRLYARGAEVFGAMDAFRHWASTPLLALGRKAPVEFMDTSIGISLLMDELGRIEHGVFA